MNKFIYKHKIHHQNYITKLLTSSFPIALVLFGRFTPWHSLLPSRERPAALRVRRGVTAFEAAASAPPNVLGKSETRKCMGGHEGVKLST